MATPSSNANTVKLEQSVEVQSPQQQQQHHQQEQPTDFAQRFPHLMLHGRPGNTLIRDGKCYLLRRSELDPRWPEPQFIDEKIFDRNRLDSLNLQHLNPDVATRNETKCICTRRVDLRSDWYAQLHDGTIVCNNCAQCNRCFILSFTAGRKLNSIDGFVLCNTCMLSYGRYKKKRLRLRLEPINRVLEKLKDATDPAEGNNNNETDELCSQCEAFFGTESKENIEASLQCDSSSNNNDNKNKISIIEEESSDDNYSSGSSSSRSSSSCSSHGKITTNNNEEKFEVLKEPRFRDEGRRPLRKAYYPNPRPANYGRPDHKFAPPPFLAVDRKEGSQACPECKQQALTSAMVVPGYARVYHEKSLRCLNCQKAFHSGYQLPEVQFQSCSCPQQPKVWCTDYKCRLARVAHHLEKSCQLAPVHPGGRPKRVVPGLAPRFDPAKTNVDSTDKKKKKKKKKPQL